MSKRAIAVLVACFGTIFFAYTVRYSYGIFLPEMLPHLGISKAEAGIIYSSFFVAYSIASPVLGVISDRYNVRVLISLFVAILAAGAFLMSLADSVTEASLYYGLAGIGAAACWTPVVAIAQRWTSESRRGLVLAIIDVGSSVSSIASGTIIPVIVMSFSWQTGWQALGICAFGMAVLDFILLRDRFTDRASRATNKNIQQPEQQHRQTGMAFIRERRFWQIGTAYLMTGFSVIVAFSFLSTYAVQERGIPYRSAALLIMVIGVNAIIGKLIMGFISDRIGRIRIMALCALFLIVGNAGIALNCGIAVLVSSVAVFGWGYGAVWPLYAASASDYFSKDISGRIVGLWTLLLGVGSLIAPVAAGWITDISGTFTWGFYLAAGGGLVSLLLLAPLLKNTTSTV